MRKRMLQLLVLLLGVSIFSSTWVLQPEQNLVWAYSYYDEDDEDEDEDYEEEDEEDDGSEGVVVDDESDEEDGYDVYFDANGGDILSGVYEITVSYGAAYGQLPTATREGFSFEGWFTKSKGGTQITEDTVCTLSDDQILHAHWKSTGGYTITYVLGDGINNKDNPDEYTKITSAITLKNPSKTDSTFGGWYTDSAYTKKVTKIAKGSKGNLTFYARWLDNPAINKVSGSKNKVTLTWKKCAGALRYHVYQATSVNGSYKSCATVKTNSVQISNLSYNKVYYYKVSAEYEVAGKIITTEKSGATNVCCTKDSGTSNSGSASSGSSGSQSSSSGSGSSNSGAASGSSGSSAAANVSAKMVFYYQYDNWNFPYEKRKVSCFCCSPAMVLHAMGYDCDPNSLYQVMGGVGYTPSKIKSKYGVKITQYNLVGKTEAARKQELYNYLQNRPQGIMIRQSNSHTQVVYLKNGEIKTNDPALKNGECIDISKSIIKKYMNIDYVILFDK